MTWVLQHSEALLTIVSLFLLIVVAFLQKAGWISKEAAQQMAHGVEEGKESLKGALAKTDMKQLVDKNGKLNIDKVAEFAEKAYKGTVKQRMLTGLKSVAGVIQDVAANADPKEERQPRRLGGRLLGLVRARVLGG